MPPEISDLLPLRNGIRRDERRSTVLRSANVLRRKIKPAGYVIEIFDIIETAKDVKNVFLLLL